MTIEEQIKRIENLIEQYDEESNPEDRMDYKQTALKEIESVRASLIKSALSKEEVDTIGESLNEFEEVFSY